MEFIFRSLPHHSCSSCSAPHRLFTRLQHSCWSRGRDIAAGNASSVITIHMRQYHPNLSRHWCWFRTASIRC